VNNPTIAFGDVRAYHDAMRLAEIQAKAPDVALRGTGGLARIVARVLKAIHLAAPAPIELLAGPNNHILGETFHSMAALRYGDYIAKLSVAPLSESVCTLTGRHQFERVMKGACKVNKFYQSGAIGKANDYLQQNYIGPEQDWVLDQAARLDALQQYDDSAGAIAVEVICKEKI
jgi:hypothetical protein